MLPKEIKELVEKYPNNQELGEQIRKKYYQTEDGKNPNGGVVFIGFLFLSVFLALLTWIILA